MLASNQNTETSEELLVNQAADGSLEAFNQLVLAYQDRIYHHTWSILQDPDSAADAAQEAFIRAYRAIHRFRGGSFRAWLFRIATNTSYDQLRRAKRRKTQPLFYTNQDGEEVESPEWIIDSSPSVQRIVENNEQVDHIYRLLRELPEHYRMAVTLVDIDEMDYAEAARVSGVPVGTLKSRVSRGRLKMREKLRSSEAYPLPEQYQIAQACC